MVKNHRNVAFLSLNSTKSGEKIFPLVPISHDKYILTDFPTTICLFETLATIIIEERLYSTRSATNIPPSMPNESTSLESQIASMHIQNTPTPQNRARANTATPSSPRGLSPKPHPQNHNKNFETFYGLLKPETKSLLKKDLLENPGNLDEDSFLQVLRILSKIDLTTPPRMMGRRHTTPILKNSPSGNSLCKSSRNLNSEQQSVKIDPKPYILETPL
jgi:hypothetical protein